jgi:hypothetical protein
MKKSSFTVLVIVLLGFAGYAYSQNVITTTTTRVVTVQPTTVTTEVTVSGTTGTVTLEIPGFLLIMKTREPGRQCTVYFTAQQPPSVLGNTRNNFRRNHFLHRNKPADLRNHSYSG